MTLDEEYYKNKLKKLEKLIMFTIVFIVLICYIIHLNVIKYNKELQEAFKNSEVLVCYETLIVTDSNWKLIENHLINNNSAGYLLIENCKIKKDYYEKLRRTI